MMAVKNDLSYAIDEEVKCPVCFELFDEPKYLQCMHIFCKRCINKLAQERALSRRSGMRKVVIVRCPTCRKPTQIGERGAKELPNIARIADIIKKSDAEANAPARSPTLQVSLCSDHKSKLSMCCHTCDMLICYVFLTILIIMSRH